MLSGLKEYDLDISAIVSMADDGGSTGVLRDELGALPPGDIRQCLVALSKSSQALRRLFNYRYKNGTLAGHSFGNLFLSTLEKTSGSFEKAVSEAGKLLDIHGRVIPVTLKRTELQARMAKRRSIIGQHNIQTSDLSTLEKLVLRPEVRINPVARHAILEADLVVICPGNFYTSIIPNLLVKGMVASLKDTRAKKVFVANIMTQKGHTDGYALSDFLHKTEKYLGQDFFSYVVYNKAIPGRKLMERYNRQGNELVLPGDLSTFKRTKFIKGDLLKPVSMRPRKGDRIIRSYVRHDSKKIAKIVYSLVAHNI